MEGGSNHDRKPWANSHGSSSRDGDGEGGELKQDSADLKPHVQSPAPKLRKLINLVAGVKERDSPSSSEIALTRAATKTRTATPPRASASSFQKTPPPPPPPLKSRSSASPSPHTPKASNSTSPDLMANLANNEKFQVPQPVPSDLTDDDPERRPSFSGSFSETEDSGEEYEDEDDDEEEREKRDVPDDISTFSCNSSIGDVSTLDNDPSLAMTGTSALSLEDLEVCQKLDSDYERALEEREIGYNARYHSVRQAALLSIIFMLAFLMLGAAFYKRQTEWEFMDALFFSIYTITTVGYGSLPMLETDGFRLYTVFYILIGIAALTIMVAQVYQFIALEASRAQYSRDRSRRGLEGLSRRETARTRTNGGNGPDSPSSPDEEILQFNNLNMPTILDFLFRAFDKAKNFFMYNEVGRSISVVFPFVGLVLVGAIVVGPLEGWGFVESIYFAVVSLTTVGYGDLFPTQTLSTWFCIIWLPFSAGFMSLFLGNVAAFYIRLSDQNVQRLERHMRRRLHRAKNQVELERIEALKRAYRGQEYDVDQTTTTGETADSEQGGNAGGSSSIPQRHAERLSRFRQRQGFDVLPSNEGIDHDNKPASSPSASRALFGSSRVADSGGERRRRILENSNHPGNKNQAGASKRSGRTIRTMKDVVRRVRRNVQTQSTKRQYGSPDYEFMSIKSNQPLSSAIVSQSAMMRHEAVRKPSFALRVLVQERFAEIIAVDIAGFQSSIEIKETTLSVSIDTLKDTANKWQIPRRARRAFRAVAFEALYFVGEHGLITRGANALLDLSPFEFHGLFSPLLAAFGDAETMENWLECTNVLADVDLHNKESSKKVPAHPTRQDMLKRDDRPLAVIMNEAVANGSPDSLEISRTSFDRLATISNGARKNTEV